jgi:hypothetical protein
VKRLAFMCAYGAAVWLLEAWSRLVDEWRDISARIRAKA